MLDYDDLILKTRALLRDPSVAQWVLFKLDGGLDHLLVDEAQDTSPDQWDVIRMLTEEFFAGEGRRDVPGTVFAVGDAKQSIYGFQRADPAAFAAMRAHFADKAGAARQRMEAVDLNVSFRSAAALLAAVDGVFAEAPARDGLMLEGHDLVHDSLRVGQAGRVEVWPPADPAEVEPPAPWAVPVAGDAAAAAEAPPRARLAWLLAAKISRWTRDPGGADDPESRLDSKDRRLEPGDIMVLVRRRNPFVEELVRALKQRGVPVAGVDRMVLSDQLAVMDLVALGRSLLLPEDDLTLASVLKGPLVGLTEERLFDLAYGRDGSLWAELKRRAAEGPDFEEAHAFLSRLQARADFVRPYELYGELLGAGGGREKLLARLGPDANDPIEEFLSLALAYEREHVPGLEGFLHWLEAGRQEIKRDLEHGADAVRIMTVHGAKGLQAPVVFLPDTLQTPPAERGLLWLDGAQADGALALWPLRQSYDGAAARQARDEARRKRQEEYRRLLYVAMTRAEDRLYVCGWNTRKAAPEDCWYNLISAAMPSIAGAESVDYDFTALVEGGWRGAGWRLLHPQGAAPEARAEAVTRVTETPLPPWALTPAPAEVAPPQPLLPSRLPADEPPAGSPLGAAGAQRFARGVLIHRLLQSLPDLPADRRRSAAQRFLGRPVHGLEPAACAAIADEVLAVIESADFAPLFGPGSRAEVPIVGAIPRRGGGPGDSAPEVVSGQVDRLLVTPEKVLIVDFKTHRAAPRDEADVPVMYLKQMALYRAVAQEIFPERQVSCLLLWTEAARLMHLSDAILERHTP